MARAILAALLPWTLLLLAAVLLCCLLARFMHARFEPQRALRLHRDQRGAVQSLSFVLTLPLLIMFLMFIVQVSQLMIGVVVVHYAAYAAARTATVWIPAYVSDVENENGVTGYYVDPDAPQDLPVVDPNDPGYGPSAGGMTLVIEPGGQKYEKIRSAAILACMPICPSRDLAPGGPAASHMIDSAALRTAYDALAPSSRSNTRTGPRLENKLAYAAANTQIELRFFHKNAEPPLWWGYIDPNETDPAVQQVLQHGYNEVGWQDQLQITIRHNLALLPGPGRLLSYFVPNAQGEDRVSSRIGHNGQVYVYPLTASCVIGNEGLKPLVRYVYQP